MELFTAAELKRTDLTCTKLTQLPDALLVARVRVTKLIGCRAAVRSMQFVNSRLVHREYFHWNTWVQNLSSTRVQFSSVQFVRGEHCFTVCGRDADYLYRCAFTFLTACFAG